eukprot:TRINITY_DN3042_c0_g1_i5.p1 TRINITY_DN3042_c0_g1~~TRINITY_DN3042_c0_g1_i5.p1  ORF type:complete len:844 (+),score=235.69 TRINITY_DN3042_c0_g1_i5:82-2532(+)
MATNLVKELKSNSAVQALVARRIPQFEELDQRLSDVDLGLKQGWHHVSIVSVCQCLARLKSFICNLKGSILSPKSKLLAVKNYCDELKKFLDTRNDQDLASEKAALQPFENSSVKQIEALFYAKYILGDLKRIASAHLLKDCQTWRENLTDVRKHDVVLQGGKAGEFSSVLKQFRFLLTGLDQNLSSAEVEGDIRRFISELGLVLNEKILSPKGLWSVHKNSLAIESTLLKDFQAVDELIRVIDNLDVPAALTYLSKKIVSLYLEIFPLFSSVQTIIALREKAVSFGEQRRQNNIGSEVFQFWCDEIMKEIESRKTMINLPATRHIQEFVNSVSFCQDLFMLAYGTEFSMVRTEMRAPLPTCKDQQERLENDFKKLEDQENLKTLEVNVSLLVHELSEEKMQDESLEENAMVREVADWTGFCLFLASKMVLFIGHQRSKFTQCSDVVESYEKNAKELVEVLKTARAYLKQLECEEHDLSDIQYLLRCTSRKLHTMILMLNCLARMTDFDWLAHGNKAYDVITMATEELTESKSKLVQILNGIIRTLEKRSEILKLSPVQLAFIDLQDEKYADGVQPGSSNLSNKGLEDPLNLMEVLIRQQRLFMALSEIRRASLGVLEISLEHYQLRLENCSKLLVVKNESAASSIQMLLEQMRELQEELIGRFERHLIPHVRKIFEDPSAKGGMSLPCFDLLERGLILFNKIHTLAVGLRTKEQADEGKVTGEKLSALAQHVKLMNEQVPVLDEFLDELNFQVQDTMLFLQVDYRKTIDDVVTSFSSMQLSLCEKNLLHQDMFLNAIFEYMCFDFKLGKPRAHRG